MSLKGFVLHVDGRLHHHNLHGQAGKDAEVVGTAISEDVVLQQFVSALGKLVEFQNLLADTLIVSVLCLKALQEVLHVALNGVGKQQAGITVSLLGSRQEERLQVVFLFFGNLVVLLFGCLYHFHRFFIHRVASDEQGILLAFQRVDGLQQDTIAGSKDAVGIDDRRHALERTDEVVDTFYLLLDAGNNLVVLPHLAIAVVQVAPQVSCLLAGVRHIEGVVDGLRIEHQSDLLALMHVPDQLLVLLHALLLVTLHECLLLLIGSLKLGLEHTKCACQVFLLEDRIDGSYEEEQQGCQKENTPFHLLFDDLLFTI